MSANDPKPFLPSKEEVTLFGSGLLVVILHMLYHMSWLIPMSLMILIPDGDGWNQVTLRLMVFSLTLLIHNRLLKYKRTFFRWLFGSLVSESLLEAYDPFRPEPTSMKGAIEQNWHWLIAAALMLPIVSGMLDFKRPWADARPSTGKFSWVGPMLEWFRIHSNSTVALAWLILVVALCLFACRVWRGALRQRQAAKD